MKLRLLITSCMLAFTMSLLGSSMAKAAGPTIDHRFYLELPDGNKIEMKGPKIMHAWQDEGGEAKAAAHCRYQEFIDSGQEQNVQRNVSDGYHCSTNESCYTQDWGAPYLPNYFNADSATYSDNDASFFAFYNKTFTSMLAEKAPGYVSMYDSENIRGFEGAKWQGKVDWEVSTGGTISFPSDPPRTPLGVDWWNKVPGYEGEQVWKAGEVYHNTEGGNVLQGKITWVLKLPEEKKPALACEAIGTAGAWNTNNVSIGQKVSFWCSQVDGANKYEFRLIEPGGNIVSLADGGADENGNKISSQHTISKAGSYTAQCRVCKDSNCTPWENTGVVDRHRDE